jgi:proteasome lid subunit RPN8/RPN11
MENDPDLIIRVKAVVRKPEKARLPGKIKRGYPTKLLVVFLSTPLLEKLRAYASSDKSYELGGVLIGKTGKSTRRTFVVIQDFIPATKGISRRASFEFTNEAQQEIHEIHQSKFKEQDILGWFHTHPGYGIFLSAADQFIDQHYFKESYHIAIVLDPVRPDVEIGIFVWGRDQQRVRVPYFTVTDS